MSGPPPDPDLETWLEGLLAERPEIDVAVAAIAERSGLRAWAGRRSSGSGRSGTDSPAPHVRTTVFDLASLTKPVTATVALELDRTGELPLDSRLNEVWPEAAPGLGSRSLSDLLRHRSGLVPWVPLAALGRPREEIDRELVTDPRWHGAAPGVYSDLGPILYARAAERRTGRAWREVVEERLLGPTGLSGALLPGPVDPARAEPCRLDGATEQRLAADLGIGIARAAPPVPGEPQDANARWLGGLAGHAGLFGTGLGVVDFGRRWLRSEGLPDREQRRVALAGRGRHALGWARRRLANSAGAALSAGSFGHVGFTGGSLWIDPERDRVFVLLAHRSTVREGLERSRRAFHRRFAPRVPPEPRPPRL